MESFEEFTKIEREIHHDMWLKPYAHFEMVIHLNNLFLFFVFVFVGFFGLGFVL